MKIPVLLVVLMTTAVAHSQDATKIKIGNPTKSKIEFYFKPEKARTFTKDPLRLGPLENSMVNFVQPGKFKTVLRQWVSASQYVDNVVGWVDFHLAAAEVKSANAADREWQFEPYTVQETRQRTYTVQVPYTVVRDDVLGNRSSVVEYRTEQRTSDYTVTRTAIKSTIWISRTQSVDGSLYISPEP